MITGKQAGVTSMALHLRHQHVTDNEDDTITMKDMLARANSWESRTKTNENVLELLSDSWTSATRSIESSWGSREENSSICKSLVTWWATWYQDVYWKSDCFRKGSDLTLLLLVNGSLIIVIEWIGPCKSVDDRLKEQVREEYFLEEERRQVKDSFEFSLYYIWAK